MQEETTVPINGVFVTMTREVSFPAEEDPSGNQLRRVAPISKRSMNRQRSISLSDIARSATVQKGKGKSLVNDARLPWYIIDPTGEIITETRLLRWREFRERLSPKERREYDKTLRGWLSNPVRWPTLFPGWDVVTALALIFTAVVTPFEVGYLPPPASATEPLFIVNRVIDVIFIVDMVFQFLLMYRVDTTVGTHESEWEKRLRKIAPRYLKGWFIIDVVSVATALFDILPIAGVGSSVGGVKTLRTIRALRLVKLLRLVKSSKVIQKLASHITLSSFWRTILSLLAKLLVAVHYYACIVAIASTFPSSPLESWLGTYGYCEPDLDAEDPIIEPRSCARGTHVRDAAVLRTPACAQLTAVASCVARPGAWTQHTCTSRPFVGQWASSRAVASRCSLPRYPQPPAATRDQMAGLQLACQPHWPQFPRSAGSLPIPSHFPRSYFPRSYFLLPTSYFLLPTSCCLLPTLGRAPSHPTLLKTTSTERISPSARM